MSNVIYSLAINYGLKTHEGHCSYLKCQRLAFLRGLPRFTYNMKSTPSLVPLLGALRGYDYRVLLLQTNTQALPENKNTSETRLKPVVLLLCLLVIKTARIDEDTEPFRILFLVYAPPLCVIHVPPQAHTTCSGYYPLLRQASGTGELETIPSGGTKPAAAAAAAAA